MKARHWRLVKLATGLALATLIAVYPTARDGSPEPVDCGTVNRLEDVGDSWSSLSTYDTDDKLIDNGDPIGLYTATYNNIPVALLDLNRPGQLSDVERLVSVTAEQYVEEAKITDLETVQRIQHSLENTNFAGEENRSQPKAMQLALWQKLGQLNVPGSLSDEIRDSAAWLDAIEGYSSIIDDSATDELFVPHGLNAQISRQQWPGWISIEASINSQGGSTSPGESITASTFATSRRALISDEGTAILHVPDPGQGWAQGVLVEWSGIIPAGTILKAVYTDKTVPSSQAYLITASAAYAKATLSLVRPAEVCADGD